MEYSWSVYFADESSWISSVDSPPCYVFGHDSAGTNYSAVADRNRKNRTVGAQRNGVANLRRTPFRLVTPRRSAAGECVIDEHDSMANEAIAANLDKLAQKAVRLDPRARTDRNTPLNLDKRPHEAIVTNLAAVKVGWLYDNDSGTKFDIHDSTWDSFR